MRLRTSLLVWLMLPMIARAAAAEATVRERLEQLLGSAVQKADDCVGPEVEAQVKSSRVGLCLCFCECDKLTADRGRLLWLRPLFEQVSRMAGGDILLLENLRFHPEEEKNDPAFAEKVCDGNSAHWSSNNCHTLNADALCNSWDGLHPCT